MPTTIEQVLEERGRLIDEMILDGIKREPNRVMRMFYAMHYKVPDEVMNELERQISEDAGSKAVC